MNEEGGNAPAPEKSPPPQRFRAPEIMSPLEREITEGIKFTGKVVIRDAIRISGNIMGIVFVVIFIHIAHLILQMCGVKTPDKVQL